MFPIEGQAGLTDFDDENGLRRVPDHVVAKRARHHGHIRPADQLDGIAWLEESALDQALVLDPFPPAGFYVPARPVSTPAAPQRAANVGGSETRRPNWGRVAPRSGTAGGAR